MLALAALPVGEHEAELYPVLQACSFGGKQIWRNGNRWANACFRDFWQPTATSIRRSPANPMQPSPIELRRRVGIMEPTMRGVACLNMDIMALPNHPIPKDYGVIVEPPYQATTGHPDRKRDV